MNVKDFNIENKVIYSRLNSEDWSGSCTSIESTLHQLSPYIGKIKSTFARRIIQTYTKPGDTILDPFAGSGTVILESLIAKRHVIANDINPYATLLIKAKMFPLASLEEAIIKTKYYCLLSKHHTQNVDLDEVPEWVKKFYNSETLKEIISLSRLLQEKNEFFLLACLLGILHHERPGFLSYPSSHLVPYLKINKYPSEKFPNMYEYRDVEPRLLSKVERTYRRFPIFDSCLSRECFQEDSRKMPLKENSIDAIISSPPYMNTLDYARDNRLRLWFLGEENYKKYDNKSPRNIEDFKLFMEDVIRNILPSLRLNSYCVFVLGDVNKTKKSINTSFALLEVINSLDAFCCEDVFEDEVPNFRRSRKGGACTKNEWVVVLKKER